MALPLAGTVRKLCIGGINRAGVKKGGTNGGGGINFNSGMHAILYKEINALRAEMLHEMGRSIAYQKILWKAINNLRVKPL